MQPVDKLRTAQKANGGIQTNPPAAKPLKAKGKASKGKKKWTPPTAEQRDQKLQARGRLPECAQVQCAWVGGKWSVCLMIPECDTFTASGSSLFKTLEAADDQYREWLELHKGG